MWGVPTGWCNAVDQGTICESLMVHDTPKVPQLPPKPAEFESMGAHQKGGSLQAVCARPSTFPGEVFTPEPFV